MTSGLLACAPRPFLKGVYFKREEFALRESKFVSFRVDPFSEGKPKQSDRVMSLENV